jgi:hypothetical protein
MARSGEGDHPCFVKPKQDRITIKPNTIVNVPNVTKNTTLIKTIIICSILIFLVEVIAELLLYGQAG